MPQVFLLECGHCLLLVQAHHPSVMFAYQPGFYVLQHAALHAHLVLCKLV